MKMSGGGREAKSRIRLVPVPSCSCTPIWLFLLVFMVAHNEMNLLLAQEVRHCTPSDLLFQYTSCDQNNNRWLFAVPRSHNFLCTPESMPAPQHGLNCSMSCPAGHFLEMHSQQCRLCQPGTFSLGDRVRYEQFEGNKLPEDFSVENSLDESFARAEGGWAANCPSGGGWTVEGEELRYRWTPCVSTLSLSLHLTRPGFAEFQYQLSKEGTRGLVQMLQVRNAQCQSYGNTRNLLLSPQWTARQKGQKGGVQAETGTEGPDIRVERLSMRRGQNLITWSVAVNPVLSSRMEMIRLIRLDISGLAFSSECTPCPAGTFSSLPGAQQCQPCGSDHFAPKGASRCEQCPAAMWAEPRSEFCEPRPACSSVDYFPVRPAACNASEGQRVHQRKISPPVCRDRGDVPFLPEASHEPCPPCLPGMHRNSQGKCEKCPAGQMSSDGKSCSACPANTVLEYGLFLTRWDSLPPEVELKMECEFLAAEDTPGECQIQPAWVAHGDRLESVPTRLRGIALELSLHLSTGFHSPLHSGKPTAENPLGIISMDIELQCRDSCQFYVVQEFESSELAITPSEDGRQLQMLALLNGTQSRRQLAFPVLDPRPRRLLIAFTRSGAVLGRDELLDKAILYSLNVTNLAMAIGMARRCAQCPRMEGGKCLPCPPGEYWMQSSCRRCPPGTVLNHTALAESGQKRNLSLEVTPCSPCPQHFERSADGFKCEFTGHFDLDVGKEKSKKMDSNEGRMHFDLSALREAAPFTARGIRVFARDGQSYQHVFNVSLFSDRPVHCHDSLLPKGQKFDQDEEALFCRSAAIPLNGDDNNGNHTAELFVSSTVISRRLLLVTQQRAMGQFHLSDDQLEYEPESSTAQRPLDVHFFFEPLPSVQQNTLSTCPNGTLAALTVRCEPTALQKPLVRLSRRCPDGTCDGCLYHVILDSAHGCPVCTAQDYREIRGECINERQQVHSIPAKHCVLSGAQAHEREEPCHELLSPNVRFVLTLAVAMILMLLIVILVIYRRNRTLEYRYSRLVEGRSDMDNGVRSCALGGSDQEGASEEEDEEEQEILDSSRARVFFNNKKGRKNGGGSKYSQKFGRAEERAEFIAEEESD